MRLDFPILIIALLSAALIQELLPALPVGGFSVKAQLLPLVVVYYLRHREWSVALTAALWGGILTDTIGALPYGITSCSLFFIGLIILLLRDNSRQFSPWSAAVPALFVSCLLPAFQILSLAIWNNTTVRPPFFRAYFAQLLALPFSVSAAVVIDAALTKVELTARNIEPPKSEVSS